MYRVDKETVVYILLLTLYLWGMPPPPTPHRWGRPLPQTPRSLRHKELAGEALWFEGFEIAFSLKVIWFIANEVETKIGMR